VEEVALGEHADVAPFAVDDHQVARPREHEQSAASDIGASSAIRAALRSMTWAIRTSLPGYSFSRVRGFKNVSSCCGAMALAWASEFWNELGRERQSGIKTTL
jgi:hypothetical protein